MDGGRHFLDTVKDLVATVKELKEWQKDVEERVNILETTQQSHSISIEEINNDFKELKTEQRQMVKKMEEISHTLKRTCTKALLEIIFIILCLFILFGIIYKIMIEGGEV